MEGAGEEAGGEKSYFQKKKKKKKKNTKPHVFILEGKKTLEMILM